MQSGGDGIGLALSANCGRVGGQVAGSGNQDMVPGFSPFESFILFESRFDGLNGMEIAILP